MQRPLLKANDYTETRQSLLQPIDIEIIVPYLHWLRKRQPIGGVGGQQAHRVTFIYCQRDAHQIAKDKSQLL